MFVKLRHAIAALAGVAAISIAAGCPQPEILPRADKPEQGRGEGLNSLSRPFTDKELFRAIDLNTPGLEKTRQFVNDDKLDAATRELHNFFRGKIGNAPFVDPEIDLIYFDEEQRQAAERSARTGHLVSKYTGNVFQLDPSRFDLGAVDFSNVDPLDALYLLGLDEISDRYRPAFFVTGDPIYVQRSSELISSYFHHFHGGARNSAPDTALTPWERWTVRHRLSHLLVYFTLFQKTDLDYKVTAKALKIILEDERLHVSRGHLWQGNAIQYMCFTGAQAGAIYYPFRESELWFESQTSLLLNGMRDLAPDGCNSDLSAAYAASYALWCDLYKPVAWLDSPRSLENVPSDVHDRIEALGEWLMNTTKPNGEYAPFNDSDRPSFFPEYARGLGAFFDYFGRSDFEWFATNKASGAPPIYQSFPPTSDTPSYAGIYVMRKGWNTNAIYLASDFGPGGWAHNHPDFGSFVLHAFGEDLIDEGRTAPYGSALHDGYSIRYWAHNVIAVDGLGQEVGPMGRAPYGQPVPTPWETNAVFDYVSGSYPLHELHPANLPGVVHQRAIYYAKPDYFLVLDRVEGSGVRRVWCKFQLGSSLTATLEGTSVHGVSQTGTSVWIIPGDSRATPAVITGQTEPRFDGWVSTDNTLTAPHAAPSIEYEDDQMLPVNYVTVIQPTRNPNTPPLRVTSHSVSGANGTGRAIRVSPSSLNYEDIYLLRHDGETVALQDRDVVFNGDLAQFHVTGAILDRVAVVNANTLSFTENGVIFAYTFPKATSAYALASEDFAIWRTE
ncbi:MAG: heparinase II/III family protein [Candidatus Hydrogenedentes bacterium]|nr:heparinase II/III family protein [Candidatus Hydrogenedentota bacterium]